MRVLVTGMFLLAAACGLVGPRAQDVREITFSEGGRDYKGDGRGSSVKFRRDGTAEQLSYTIQHDIAHNDTRRTASFSTDQFERLAKAVLASYSFREDLYHGGTDSGQSITVTFADGQSHYAAFSYDNAQFGPVVAAASDVAKRLQWKDAPAN